MHTHSKHSSKHVDSLDFHLFSHSFVLGIMEGYIKMLYKLVYLVLSTLTGIFILQCTVLQEKGQLVIRFSDLCSTGRSSTPFVAM